ncbi:MAG: GTP 3',8-cyclase MoaA [Acidimicrobiia bacterium]|nr:GTP 3',8-cyclase MoaA [Acidimicrobiia bacterium]
MTNILDTLGRPIRDLRISVTDRCNFRCTYCMPKEIFNRDYEFLPRAELLTFEEMAEVARVFAGFGVNKIRLTGGEPLMRKGIEKLIGSVKAIDGIEDVTLTTNGSLLKRDAAKLVEAGLDRVTVSLDSLNDDTFMAMNDAGYTVAQVLEGIEAAAEAGLAPIKINAVVQKGVNDHEVVEMAEHFRGTAHLMRFIEYMDVGTTNGWRLNDVFPAREIVAAIHAKFPLEPADPNYRGEVAQRYRYKDGVGEIGVISSVTQPFCRDCTRARLSAEGKLYTCLFAGEGTDLRAVVRDEPPRLAEVVAEVWSARTDRYSEQRSEATLPFPKVEMSYIGG